MPLHDYKCDGCGHREIDVYRPVTSRATDAPPECCGVPMVWLPQIGAMDCYESFEEIHQVIDSQGTTVRIDSLRKLRQVEKDSEQRARDGVGQPLVWRDYSQDRSNFDRHTLAPDPSEKPSLRTRSGLPMTKSAYSEDPGRPDCPATLKE